MQYIVDKIEVYARFKDGNNGDDIEGIKYTLSKLSKEQRLEVLGSVIG